MTANELRQHLRYSTWASAKLLDAVRKLNADDLARDLRVSHGSILGTLSHIHFADRIWYSRVVDPQTPYKLEASLDVLETKWPEIHAMWEAWAESLTDAEVTRVIPYKLTDGTPHQTPIWQIILHVVNHATLHRGQAVAMLRQVGVKPPSTDLIGYYRETSAVAAG
jgi:uncharacterized damage-inducible protein DinB